MGVWVVRNHLLLALHHARTKWSVQHEVRICERKGKHLRREPLAIKLTTDFSCWHETPTPNPSPQGGGEWETAHFPEAP